MPPSETPSDAPSDAPYEVEKAGPPGGGLPRDSPFNPSAPPTWAHGRGVLRRTVSSGGSGARGEEM